MAATGGSGSVGLRLRLARPRQPTLIGMHHRLHAVPQFQLGQNARHMRFDRGLAQHERLGDFGAALAAF